MGMSWDRGRCLGIQVSRVAVLQGLAVLCHPQGVLASPSGQLLSVSGSLHTENPQFSQVNPLSTALGPRCAQSPGNYREFCGNRARVGPSSAERHGLGKPRARRQMLIWGRNSFGKSSGDAVHPPRASSSYQVGTGAVSGVTTLRLSKPGAAAPIYYLAMLVQNPF